MNCPVCHEAIDLNNAYTHLMTQHQLFMVTYMSMFNMFDDDIDIVLNKINTELLVVRIPVKLTGEDDFHLEVSRKDLSHVNCKTKEEWINKIEKYNFKYKDNIITKSIFDSPGVFCGYFKKI